jgi:hypothetical protein
MKRNPITTQTTTTNKPSENTFKPLIIPGRKKLEETKGTLFVKDEEFKPSEEKSEYTTTDSEPDGPIWNLDPMIKNLSKKFFDKSTRIEYDAKTQTRNHVRQYHENMFANYTLRSLKVANLIKKMVNTEVQYIFDVKFALLDYLDSNYSKKGGHADIEKNNEIVNELNIKEGDSQHDFKASKFRNNVFPENITKSSKIATVYNHSLIIDKISKIVSNAKTPRESRWLNDYFESSPGDFEEDVKIDYFLGELVGNLDDISYYFTGGKDSVSSTWVEKRKKFFETTDVNEIDKLFEDVSTHNIEYWVLDACMYSYVTKGMLPIKFRTLANMWDPATSANPTLEELGENIISNNKDATNSFFVEVDERPADNTIPKGIKIYDWRNNNGESYYDLIYDELINRDLMTTFYGIKIKIRTAVEQVVEKKSTVNKCSVAVCLYVDDVFKNVIFIHGGFGVNELAMGMHYIETGAITYTKGPKTYQLRTELKTLLDTLNRYFINTGKKRKDSSNEFFKNEYYKLLLRFKSSGDHGQARTVKILNTLLNKATVFISGDALAYVYSIAEEIPTICKYYAGKGDAEDEDENEDEDNEEHKGPLFVAGYFPMKDNKEKYEKLFNRRISTIGDLYISEYINPNLNKTPIINEISVEEFKTLKTTIVNLIIEGEAFVNELQPFKKDIINVSKAKTSKSIQNKEEEINAKIIEKIQKIYTTNVGDKSLLTMIECVPHNIDRLFLKDDYDYASMKEYNSLIDHFIKTWYFVKHYVKIVKLVKENINDMIKSLDFIMTINEEQILNDIVIENRRENSRSKGTPLHTNLSGLNDKYKEIQKNISSIDKDLLLNIAESVAGKSESKTLRETLINIRSTLINNKKNISSKLNLELGMQPQFYSELSDKIEILKEEYLIKIKNKIEDTPTFGKAINDYFSKCFETNIKMDKPTIIAEIEELKADAEEKKPEAEQQVETIFINIKAAEANEILKELDTQETLPVIPLEKAKKLGKKKEIVEESVNDMAIDEVKETLTSVVPVFKSSRLQIMEEKRRKAQEEAAEEERKRKEAELKKKEQIRAATLKRLNPQPKGGKRTLKKNTKYSTYKKRKHQRQNKSISKKRD